MLILVACEESQAVTKEFRKLGHFAFSCDILSESGGHPEWHIQDDVLNHINMDCWDVIIAFPPCTHLAVSGARYFAEKRKDGRQQAAIDFFMQFANANAKHIAIENPVSIMSTVWRKPDQYIQPFEYGHPESKKTCLWLTNLPRLKPTKILDLPERGYWDNQTPSGRNNLPPSPDRARLRSKTYQGVADAMAEQWGEYLIRERKNYGR
jgi:hypothetical protein